jgi:serine-aspartate repeat-containing protein C/D/E
MRRIYIWVAVAVLCLGGQTAFAQSYIWAPATVNNSYNDTIDFGFIGNFFIGDWVWYDSNNNGLQDEGEEGIPGVVVELWQGDKKIDTKITEDEPNKGRYVFPGLRNGEYVVRIPMPQLALEGMVNTAPNVPPDDSIDSDGMPN